jgi:choline dehydrogenase-like flavoprotein
MMITVLFPTTRYSPPHATLDLRTDIDGWEAQPLPGVYDDALGAWTWKLDFARYGNGFTAKLYAAPFEWQDDPSLAFAPPPAGGSTLLIRDGEVTRVRPGSVTFPNPTPTTPVTDPRWVQRALFDRDVDRETLFDVLVIGFGMGGGTVADHLADSGLNTLVLEAGGLVFPTHIGNLPRPQAAPGAFSKHIWTLWERFKVINYDRFGDYIGGQGFNLGGRSLFWGGFIPRMTSWELDLWPERIKWYLEDAGYLLAEDFMGRSNAPRTLYNREVQLALRRLFPDMHHADAPVAIRQRLEGSNAIPGGVFSTADVLTESLLTDTAAGNGKLQLLLNHQALEIHPGEPAEVVVRDLQHDRTATYRARRVVVAAGCFESARLVKRSADLPDPLGLVGVGVSDHPIYYTHFRVPRSSRYFDPYAGVKVLSQPREGADPAARAPFNMLLELGSDLNHGRYFDDSIWEEHLRARADYMLGEVVFLCNELLLETNRLTFSGPEFRPEARIVKYARPNVEARADAIKWRLLKELGAQPTTGPAIDFNVDEAGWMQAFRERKDAGEGMPGGVAHEVGSLRMRVPEKAAIFNRPEQEERPGVVDDDLRFLGAPNVYVCDLSVFPTTPAANPSLTLVALAIRLAEHLRRELAP